jgi:tripartite-type tricarboxylate transporter receptor subunit TctC
MRKGFILGVVACVTLGIATLTAAPASAQEWPNRPIRLIVGFGAGGGTDIVGRIVAQALSEKLKQPMVVENRPGAGGIIGSELVAKAQPDGHTLLMMANAHIIAGVMYKKLPYETLGSFEPVGQIASAGLIIVTRPDFPAKDVKELIELAKAKPGAIKFASVGHGSTQHFTGELFRQHAGIDILHVPYKGSPAAIAAVMNKEVDVLFETVSAVLGPVRSGDLKALAVTGLNRFPAVPNVPTAAESGVVPGYEVTTWYGMFAPKGTPAKIIAQLNASISEVLARDDVKKRISDAGAIARGTTPEEFRKHLESELAKWGAVREKAGIEQQ